MTRDEFDRAVAAISDLASAELMTAGALVLIARLLFDLPEHGPAFVPPAGDRAGGM